MVYGIEHLYRYDGCFTKCRSYFTESNNTLLSLLISFFNVFIPMYFIFQCNFIICITFTLPKIVFNRIQLYMIVVDFISVHWSKFLLLSSSYAYHKLHLNVLNSLKSKFHILISDLRVRCPVNHNHRV